VTDTSSDSIVPRALSPLPDLSTIVFFRRANRDFVTGKGPFAAEASRGARKFIRWGMWVLLIAGLGMSLVVGAIEIYLHQQSGTDNDLDFGYLVGGPVLLFVGAFYGMIAWIQSRRAGKEARLTAEGGLLPATLIKTKYYSGSGEGNSPSLRVDYRFTAPDGQTVEKRQSLSRFDFTRKALPPEGSPLLVLYVDAGLFEVL
jgi:hypothetical protein